MKEGRLGSASRAAGALCALLVACGAKSALDLDALGGGAASGTAGASSGNGGASANASGGESGSFGATGASSQGGSSNGGATSGGSSPGGACAAPDFDLSVVPDQAVAYMIDPSHTGAQLATTIKPPLGEIWRYEFETGVSYPLIVDSRVFVTVNDAVIVDGSPVFGAIVRAFDAASGEPLWQSELVAEENEFGPFAVHLAYDRGRLFAASEGGLVVAFDPTNGAVHWRVNIEDVYGFGTMPVASGGAVFYAGATGGDETLFVLDQCDGDFVYRGRAQGIGQPTLGASMLFSTGGCHETEALLARDGSAVWHYQEDCFGGGGDRSVYRRGALYVESSPEIIALDVNSGDRLVSLDEPAPFWPLSVTDDDVVVQSLYLGNYALKVFDPAVNAARWSVALPVMPRLPALVTPGYAFVFGGETLGDKFLYAVDLVAREVVWRSEEPALPRDIEWVDTGTEPFQAMAAGGGRIVVAYNGTLVAYEPVEAPECGNGVVEGGEACDDSNVEGGDYCSAACDAVTGRCGDGVVQSNETCDGAQTPDGATCGDTCQVTFDGVMLAAGNLHTCGLRRNGSVTCWGADAYDAPPDTYRYVSAHESWAAGLLTNGSPVFWGRYRTNFSATGPFIALEAGLDSYCALDDDGRLHCEGEVTTPAPSRRYTELSMFTEDFCALTAGGELWCYHDGVGVLWGGTFRAVAVGGGGTCAVRDDRTLLCSGDLDPPAGEFTAVTAGFYFQCGIRTSGDLACWGNLTARGSGSLAPPAGKFALIDAGWQHVCGIRTDGVTVCWGANDYGQSTPPGDFP